MSTEQHKQLSQEHRPKTLTEHGPAVRELVAQGIRPADIAEMLKLEYSAVMSLLAAA